MMPQPSFAERWTTPNQSDQLSPTYAVSVRNGASVVYGAGPLQFALEFENDLAYRRFLSGDLYTTAMDFVGGRFDIRGDFISAVAFKAANAGSSLSRLKSLLFAVAPMWSFEALFQSRRRARKNITFHYDHPIDFYEAFLDSRLVYSCGYFRTPDEELDIAQVAKLDLICHKLDLRPGDRFLDIGCGWGGLLLRAAATYGAHATGCTLSASQARYVRRRAEKDQLSDRVNVHDSDVRDLQGTFDKIASVGMFEHVGRSRLSAYFTTVYRLLAPDGQFMNHGILRPQTVKDGPDTRFLRSRVFPGGELAHLSDVVRIADEAGFEALDVENLRPHYAITCLHWVRRLIEAEQRCVELVGQQTYRTWLLYLAASSLSFQEGRTEISQILFAKRSSRVRRLTREYMYGSERQRT